MAFHSLISFISKQKVIYLGQTRRGISPSKTKAQEFKFVRKISTPARISRRKRQSGLLKKANIRNIKDVRHSWYC